MIHEKQLLKCITRFLLKRNVIESMHKRQNATTTFAVKYEIILYILENTLHLFY